MPLTEKEFQEGIKKMEEKFDIKKLKDAREHMKKKESVGEDPPSQKKKHAPASGGIRG